MNFINLNEGLVLNETLFSVSEIIFLHGVIFINL